jgi:hypothetical protein
MIYLPTTRLTQPAWLTLALEQLFYIDYDSAEAFGSQNTLMENGKTDV